MKTRFIQKINLLITAFAVGLFLHSCQSSTSPKINCFKTKQDSLNFAKNVLQIYPELQGPLDVEFSREQKNWAARPSGFDGIDYKWVKIYANNYDSVPLFLDKRGFIIHEEGLSLIKNNPNYKLLYLRFGKRTSDRKVKNDYTVMILPLKSDSTFVFKGDGTLSRGTDSNYDYLDPCPKCLNSTEPDIE